MSKMYIREYEQVVWLTRGQHAIPLEPAVATQTISFTGTHGESAALNVRTKFVRVFVDGVACLEFGTAPTATDGAGIAMASGQTEYFGVTPEGSLKISAVTRT